MNKPASDPTAPGAATKAQSYQAARAQTLKRVHRYKRGFTTVAIVGFGALSLALAHPDLSALTAATQTNQTIQSTPTATSTFFNQSGGTVNGTSTQSPAANSAAS